MERVRNNGSNFYQHREIFANSGWAQIFFAEGGWKYAVMICVACVLLYLAIVKQFEPLLLLPIGFGMLMTNLPWHGIFHMQTSLVMVSSTTSTGSCWVHPAAWPTIFT